MGLVWITRLQSKEAKIFPYNQVSIKLSKFKDDAFFLNHLHQMQYLLACIIQFNFEILY